MKKKLSDEEEEETEYYLSVPKPLYYLTKLITLQIDLIYTCIFSLFISPTLSLLSLATQTKQNLQSTLTHGGTLLFKKLGLGLIGAAYVAVLLVTVTVVSAVVGVSIVRCWVEEPIVARESVHFDYAVAQPSAVFQFRGGKGVPVGHTFHVSVVLFMPESDFNRDIGNFQLRAELLSHNGLVISKSSQPCMLRFQSLPIRITRTFMMSVPLLLGISSETQTLTVHTLKHKEKHRPRTQSIRVTLIPRAGTSSLPQLYEAEIIMNSKLPFIKQIVRNWRWTFSVWATLYVYLLLIALLVCCFRPLLFPMVSLNVKRDQSSASASLGTKRVQDRVPMDQGREFSETLKKWQKNRNKRKAMLAHRKFPESSGGGSSAASSISLSRDDDTSMTAEEDVGDSGSVCV